MVDKHDNNKPIDPSLMDTQRLLLGVQLPEDAGFNLDDILAEFGGQGEARPDGEPPPPEPLPEPEPEPEPEPPEPEEPLPEEPTVKAPSRRSFFRRARSQTEPEKL